MSEVSFDLGRYSLSQSKPSAYDFCEDGAAFVATRYGKGQFGILFGYKETFSQTEHEHQRFVARGGSGKKRVWTHVGPEKNTRTNKNIQA